MSSYSIRKGNRKLYNYITVQRGIYIINFEDMTPGHPYSVIHFTLAWEIEHPGYMESWYWFNKNPII